KFIDTPVKRYSSGMSVRLAFAVAAYLEPEILLVDEVLAVGVAEFQRRSLGRMEHLSQSGRTVLFVSHNMQAVAQLCDRALLLDGGRIVNDGPSAEIVAEYLQAGHGSSSSRAWGALDDAPGDELVRLRSARVLQEGAVAFNALDTSARWQEPTTPGEYVSIAWIPGNLLNEGLMSVDVAICSLDGTKFHHRAAQADALSFHVHDPGLGDSARGQYTGQVRGVVRPLLEWTAEER